MLHACCNAYQPSSTFKRNHSRLQYQRRKLLDEGEEGVGERRDRAEKNNRVEKKDTIIINNSGRGGGGGW
jgi:hypothetical protein